MITACICYCFVHHLEPWVSRNWRRRRRMEHLVTLNIRHVSSFLNQLMSGNIKQYIILLICHMAFYFHLSRKQTIYQSSKCMPALKLGFMNDYLYYLYLYCPIGKLISSSEVLPSATQNQSFYSSDAFALEDPSPDELFSVFPLSIRLNVSFLQKKGFYIYQFFDSLLQTLRQFLYTQTYMSVY